MNPKANTTATMDRLEERLTQLLSRIENATGGRNSASASEDFSPSSGTPGSESSDLSGTNRQLLDRMEQILLAASTSSSSIQAAEQTTRQEIQALAQSVQRRLADETANPLANESIVTSWGEQLDRIERQLASLREAFPAPARFE